MKKIVFIAFGLFVVIILVALFFFFDVSDSSSTIPLTSPAETHEGLNIFQYSAEEGVIRGAYIEGSARVDFEGIRVGIRPFFSLLMEPDVGLYDVSACYILTSPLLKKR
ncbi:hypothetical protein HZA99_02035 [Candidatus Woesearchaeota archaeon]|nr:hypothetical protein [Candidatus Woesearchaeota archaeon]